MCGIAGVWLHPTVAVGRRDVIESMTSALQRRGPDDAGTLYEQAAPIAFGHRRLSIVDLSPHGHQPMVSASGRFVIAYNGEIYNAAELRSELERDGKRELVFRGHSDTEVLLAAIEAWGLDGALTRSVGMFAFSLWDRQQRLLYLVRDRLGIKPLYLAHTSLGLLWASGTEALRQVPEFSREIDRDGLASFLRLGCVPAPRSIYAAARKVRPGTFVMCHGPGCEQLEERCYWSAPVVARNGMDRPFQGSDAEAVEELDRLLRLAVRQRLVSDVPLGAFLSGGIDSSTVVGIMQALSPEPVRTFSIGNEQPAFDEASDAERVARHLGTSHTAITVTAAEARQVIVELPTIYDEPFADSSQIPTFLVSRLARQDVTVALSGDGGDELFGGYNRHVWGPRVWSLQQRVPRALLIAAARLLTAIPTSTWDQTFALGAGVLPNLRLPGQKVHKLARVLASTSIDELYGRLTSQSDSAFESVPGSERHRAHLPRGMSAAAAMMLGDLTGYLPDDILTKVDRASMAVSLEARVPILDHRVVEFAWGLPMRMKVREGEGKWILRRVLERYVPNEMFDRPKMGFGVPLAEWLRGPLREWAEDLLSVEALSKDGHLDPSPIRQLWEMHLSGRRDWEQAIWAVLMFQCWRSATS